MMIDPNGVTNRFTYHSRGWLLKREVFGSSGNAITEYTYDAAGQRTAIKLPDGATMNYFYDAAHRLQAVSNSLGEGIVYTLDSAGNITREETKNAAGAIVRTQRRVFDELSRLLHSIGAANQTNSVGYDGNGNPLTLRDGFNRNSAQTFDALDRLTSIIDPLTNKIEKAYDAQDRLTSIRDPRSLATSYVRDGFGRIIQETSPDRGVTLYALDETDNRVSEKDARGVVTQRSFDKLNRVLSEIFPASPSENISYSYDSTASGNKGVGHLTGFTDETGSTGLRYDERGNMVSMTWANSGHVFTTQYGFDLADHVIKLTYPSGHIIDFARDSLGRINAVSLRTSATAALTPLATNVAYLPFGPVAELIYGNGLSRSNRFDADYRLTSIDTQSADTSVQRLRLSYDAANNITNITDLLDQQRTQRFDYDALYRLTNAVGSYGTLQYAYDSVGNRLSETSNSVASLYTYPADANRLTAVNGGSNSRNFTYTANGNIATDSRNTGNYAYTYGNRNRLKTVAINGSLIATYAYNAFGQRLVKTDGTVVTLFHYDAQSHLIAESDGQTGAVMREYVWLDDIPLAFIENGQVYLILPDHLNTPQKITDSNRSVVWDRIQTPFGETISLTSGSAPRLQPNGFDTSDHFKLLANGMSGFHYVVQRSLDLRIWVPVSTNTGSISFTETSNQAGRAVFYRCIQTENTSRALISVNLRFPGHYFDLESGFNQNFHRDYDPSTGSYSEFDPIGFNGGANPRSYANNAPVEYVDTTGLRVFSIAFTGSGGAGVNIFRAKGIVFDSDGNYKVYKSTSNPDEGVSLPGLFGGITIQTLGTLGHDSVNLDSFGGGFVNGSIGGIPLPYRLSGSVDAFYDPNNPNHIGLGLSVGKSTDGISISRYISHTCFESDKRNIYTDVQTAIDELRKEIDDGSFINTLLNY